MSLKSQTLAPNEGVWYTGGQRKYRRFGRPCSNMIMRTLDRILVVSSSKLENLLRSHLFVLGVHV